MTDIAELGIKVDSRGALIATKNLDKLEKQGGKTEKRAKSMGAAFGKVLSVLASGALFKTVIANTIEQERVTAQLEATLKSTGRYTPQLSKGLQDYAAQLQSVTTFGDEAILSSTAMLLSFRQIGEEAFPRAQQSILDVATAMGTDLKSATIQVGKALNDPKLGLDALTRSGITFSDEQKTLIKSLVDAGQMAKAQAVILKELETQFGGSAEAARNTLGGALKSLKNSFGDLLEGGGGNVNDAAVAINSFNDLLNSPGTKRAFEGFVGGIFSILEAVAKVPVAFATFGEWIGESVARMQGFTTLQDQIVDKQEQIAEVNARLLRSEEALRAGRGDKENVIANATQLLQLKEELDLLKQIGVIKSAGGAKTPSFNVPVLTRPGGSKGKSKGGSSSSSGLGPLIRIEAEELTERNLIMEEYNRLLEQSETIASQVKAPQEVFNEQIALLNKLRDTMNLTNGEQLLSQAQYVEAVKQAQDALSASTQETADEMSEFAIQAARNMESALSSGFFDIMQGNFDSLGSGFRRTIDQMVADLLASQLLDAASSLFSAGASGGGSGGLISAAASIFGGARAEGGPISAGKSYLVGEKGPELITPKQSGTVIPNNQMGGGMSVTINVSGVTDEGGLRRSAGQIAQQAGAAASRASRRNG